MPEFLDIETLLQLHQAEIALSPNEPSGILDLGRLESAISAPVNHYLYTGEADICFLAAIYAERIARGHPFMSGNKRAALAACITFLVLNGFEWVKADVELGMEIESIVTGKGDKDSLARFLRTHSLSSAD